MKRDILRTDTINYFQIPIQREDADDRHQRTYNKLINLAQQYEQVTATPAKEAIKAQIGKVKASLKNIKKY